jgi:hypothetical protein
MIMRIWRGVWVFIYVLGDQVVVDGADLMQVEVHDFMAVVVFMVCTYEEKKRILSTTPSTLCVDRT